VNLTLKLQSICGLILILAGCTGIHNTQYEEYASLKLEAKECLTNYTYTNTRIISGTAKFFKRGINLIVQSAQLQGMALGDPLVEALPIRYAEVAVYNSKNQIVQCGLTDVNGNLKAYDGSSDLLIPNESGHFSVRVFARANITLAAPVTNPAKPEFDFHVAVKKDIYTNEVHTISRSFYSNGVDDTNNLDLIAYARQTDAVTVDGGAFNIFNSIYTAFDYIRNQTGDVDISCLNEKLNVYWKLGFNPYQYTSPNSDPSTLPNGSYYDSIEKNLYITGGRLGDITIDVTNHFDDFVIMHELAHHIENLCGTLATPGGQHAVITRIDPRLAWAEGWANYFAGEVMYTSISTDSTIGSVNPEIGTKLSAAGFSPRWTYFFGSKGFSDSYQNIGQGSGFMFDMTKPGNNPDSWQYGQFSGYAFDKVDPSRYPGEGHFREGAISRGLFKISNNCGNSCITSTPVAFENIWKSMDKITGAGQSAYPFKSSHTVMEFLKSFIGSGTWAASYKTFNEALTSEALQIFSDGIYTSAGINRWVPYGTELTTLTTGACSGGQYYIEPRVDDPVLTGTNSDQRYSNQYYTIDLGTLAAVDEISVNLTKQNTSGTNMEFDLILYQQGYFFAGDYTCSATNSAGNCSSYAASRTTTSDMVRSDRRSGALTTKTIKNLQTLDHTKKYLLNIRAYTASKSSVSILTDYSYTLTNQAGAKICP
jgi:hypothetical protein